MAHLVNSVSDVLDALQRDRALGRPHVKADLQRAPARGSRPRGCANGEWEWSGGCPSWMTWVPRFIPTTSPTCPTDETILRLCAEDFLLLGSTEHPTYTLPLSQPDEVELTAPIFQMRKVSLRGCSLTTSTQGEAESQPAPKASALEPT